MKSDYEHKPDMAGAVEAGVEEEKRVAARRRFLRIGAGGSAALVMTVTHRRAFAGGIKKGNYASNCVSLMGHADLTGAKHKNVLQLSAMGTPKNMICRPKHSTLPVGDCTTRFPSRYTNENGDIFSVVDGDELNKGCGSLDGVIDGKPADPTKSTIGSQFEYRLYGQDKLGGKPPGYGDGDGGGYCPIDVDLYRFNGDLNYRQLDYFKRVEDPAGPLGPDALQPGTGKYRVVKVDACKPAPLP